MIILRSMANGMLLAYAVTWILREDMVQFGIGLLAMSLAVMQFYDIWLEIKQKVG